MTKSAQKEFEELGIPTDSQLAQVARRYNMALLVDEGPSLEQLEDPYWPQGSMLSSARFVHDTWGLPDNFVPVSSCEGEDCYLYDKTSGAVWDFDLALRSEFLAGAKVPMFVEFFDFMRWYLGAPDAPQPYIERS